MTSRNLCEVVVSTSWCSSSRIFSGGCLILFRWLLGSIIFLLVKPTATNLAYSYSEKCVLYHSASPSCWFHSWMIFWVACSNLGAEAAHMASSEKLAASLSLVLSVRMVSTILLI